MLNQKLYAAYGSNLDVRQMSYRCPNAKIVGISTIENYRLMYKGSLTGSYATIEPEKGQRVQILIWSISETDEASLDRYEGYNKNGYSFYNKKDIEVQITSLSGESLGNHTAMVYIMDESRKHEIPTKNYEDILRQGYKRFGFDNEILDEAMRYTKQQMYRELMSE